MGGGASKTKTKAVQRVDRVIVVGGQRIYSRAARGRTLRDAKSFRRTGTTRRTRWKNCRKVSLCCDGFHYQAR